jgi:hypothetical protein
VGRTVGFGGIRAGGRSLSGHPETRFTAEGRHPAKTRLPTGVMLTASRLVASSQPWLTHARTVTVATISAASARSVGAHPPMTRHSIPVRLASSNARPCGGDSLNQALAAISYVNMVPPAKAAAPHTQPSARRRGRFLIAAA